MVGAAVGWQLANWYLLHATVSVQSDKSTYMFLSLLLSFVLFRFFDITKIGPIKRFENLPNGIGIMADDIVAGLFALVTQAAILTSLNQNIYIKTLWN